MEALMMDSVEARRMILLLEYRLLPCHEH